MRSSTAIARFSSRRSGLLQCFGIRCLRQRSGKPVRGRPQPVANRPHERTFTGGQAPRAHASRLPSGKVRLAGSKDGTLARRASTWNPQVPPWHVTCSRGGHRACEATPSTSHASTARRIPAPLAPSRGFFCPSHPHLALAPPTRPKNGYAARRISDLRRSHDESRFFSDRGRYRSALTSIWRLSESSTKCVRIWFVRQHTGQSSMYVMSKPPPMSGVVSTMFPQCGQRYATESPYRRCRRSMKRL